MASTSKKALHRDFMFSDFCALCEKISSVHREKKAKILQKFIADYRTTNDISFYRVLRLLLPMLDRERAAYGIKEFVLAKIYIRILCLNPDSNDALKLKNFRAPKNAGESAGDFGNVAYWVLKNRLCNKGNDLTLDDVHCHLDNIARHHAEKKPREVDKEMEVMLHRMSAQEQKWLIRIVLKDLRLSMGQNRILAAYHPDARELFDICNSLKEVCEKLNDRTKRLYDIELTLFNPCLPMLSERCDVQDISKHFSRRPGPRYSETKLDGERSQLHYSNGEFKFFSRKAFDFTDSFGRNSSSGSLTPYLAKQLKPGVRNCILDGEMMPWNTKYKRFGSKAMNLDVKSLRVGNVHQPCFCVFDVLYFNDTKLINKPFRERLGVLEGIYTPCEGIMMEPARKLVNSADDVLQALNDAIDNVEEGIVVKEPESFYKPNGRKDGWIKIKPEYTPGAMVELDLIIIGGYYGEGRRRQLISHFLLAVAQPPPSPGGEPVVFESMTRIGSGCTIDELATLGQQLKPHWKRYRPGSVPPGILWTREKPELWIEPRNSVILQVKASEVVQSDAYQTGYTLRFPRIEKVRYDKPWTDCLTTVEFTNLRQNASGSLVDTHITQLSSSQVRKRKATRTEPTIGANFRNANLDCIKALSQLFSGKEFCVLTGLPEISKQDLECKIVENGGNVVLNPGKTTCCVIVGEEKHIRVKNVCKSDVYDVVRAQWLLHCIDNGELLPWTPMDMIRTSPSTASRMAQQYDQHGDSYTEPATLHSLQNALTKVDKKDILPEKMSKMDAMLFGGCSPFSFFRGCVAYFDCFEEVENELKPQNTPLEMLMFDFKFHSGLVTAKITSETTHIILHSSEFNRLEELISRAEQSSTKAHIIQHYWLLDCLDVSAHLVEDKYELHKWAE